MSLIRIGTRNSPLAMWQALEVKKKIKELGFQAEIIPITSSGDKDLTQPLYQMDIIGVFTRDLDIALLNDKIDLAVHSLKDVPTILPEGIFLSAVLERDYEADVLIRNPNKWDKKEFYDNLYIGTGSLRRRAFWKAKFPEVTFGNIRGNVQTRLSKLDSEGFDGTIFSLAGIKRLGLPLDYELLDFIIPAPAQGVVGITSLEKNKELTELVRKINHKNTQICIDLERDFLNKIEGGCTAPIGALARIENNHVIFKAGIVSLDGTKKILLDETFTVTESSEKGKTLALKAKKMGAEEIINEIRTYRE